jgi:hypothetical protein
MAASAGTLFRNATKALLGVSATFNFSNNLTFVNNPWLSSNALPSIVASMGTAVVSQVSSGTDVEIVLTGLQVQTIANANAIVSQSGFQCALSPLTATIGNVTASHATPALSGVYATSTTSGLGGLATSRTLTSTTGVTSSSGALGGKNSLAISAPSSSITLGAVAYGKGFQAATNLVTSGTPSTLATAITLQTTSASAINTSFGALARAWLLSLSGAQTSATPGLVGKSFGFLLDDAGDIVSEGALTLSIEHSPVTLLGAAITSAPGGITGQNSELLTGVHATASPGALSLSTTITPNGLQIAITKGNFLSLNHSPATLDGTAVTFSSSGIYFNNNLTVNGTQINSASSNLNYTNSFIWVLTGQSFTASAGRTNAFVNGVMHLDIFGESVMLHAGGLIFRPEMGGNTSATGGYLLYHDDLNALTDSQLQNFLHDWIAGITGFAAGNVRPRWQVEPGNLPDVMVDWIAFGITSKITQGYPFLKHVDSTDFYPNGHDELHSHRRIKVLITIYGPNAERTEMILSRGAYVAQNREPLGVVNIGLVGCGDSTTIPEFIKQQWMMRVDLPIEFNQEVILDYNVLNILSSGTTITTEEFVNVSDATTGCEVIK